MVWAYAGHGAPAVVTALVTAAALGALGALSLATVMAVLGVFGGPVLLVPRRWRRWHRHRRARGRQRSARVPKRLHRMVLAADRHRCVACGERARLQVDHIEPWSLGGLTCLWNLAVLCQGCNRVKSNYWVAPGGHRYYRPFEGHGDRRRAAAILALEQAARRRPLRWLRAFAAAA
jgi:5-methylcytosine-specific restriction endonuclease McrA